MQPPRFHLLAGSPWKKIVAGAAFAAFVYAVWQLMVLKREDRVAALMLCISFVVIFALSISDALRHRSETREWMKSRSRPPENNARDVT